MFGWLKKVFKILCVLSIFIILGFLIFLSINLFVDKYSVEYCYYNSAEVPQADAIIVLGAQVYAGGRTSPTLAERLDTALELYTAGKAPKMILSGDHGTKEYDEVNAMKEYMLDRGVPREDIFLDHAGFNTYDSMYRAKEVFCVNSLLISTQQFHISRAVYIARKLGIEAYGYPSVKWDSYYEQQYGLRESFAKIKAFLDVEILKRNPKFLGEPIPIDGNGIVTEG